MSQNSLTVANGTGAAVRSALNNALDTLVTLNSGASAPSTTQAYMLWADTTTGLLKIRNAVNSAWVTIGTLASANLALLPLAGGTMTGALVQAVGANVASASTIDLTAVAGNACHVTGTTTITAVTLATGKFCEVIFDGALTLTHHATNNNLPGGINIPTAAGDRALYWSDGTTVYCLHYQRANGTAVVGASAAIKIAANTWNLASASGNLVIPHGGSGTPKAVVVLAAIQSSTPGSGATIIANAGFSDGSGVGCLFQNGTAGQWNAINDRCIFSVTDASNYVYSLVPTFDATNVTFPMVKGGSPTGTLQVTILAQF